MCVCAAAASGAATLIDGFKIVGCILLDCQIVFEGDGKQKATNGRQRLARVADGVMQGLFSCEVVRSAQVGSGMDFRELVDVEYGNEYFNNQ